MTRLIYTLLIGSLVTLDLSLVEAAPVSNASSNVAPPSDSGKELSYRASTIVTSCSLSSVEETVSGDINDYLTAGVNLIKFHIAFKDGDTEPQTNKTSSVYKPLFWVRSPTRLGNGLLLLRPEYDVLSLKTLELHVATLHVKVDMSPPNCLSQLSLLDTEKVLRALVMNNFINSSINTPVSRPDDRVCNLHATDNNGVVDFRYLCCREDMPDYIYCKYLESDDWLGLLFALLIFVKVLVVLFSPLFVPDSMYREKHEPAPFVHKCPDDTTASINVVVTDVPNTYPRENVKTFFPLSAFKSMETFSKCLTLMEPEKPYRVTFDQIHISVAEERLLSTAQEPVGVFKTLYESFVQCRISERDALTDCCQADVFSRLPCKPLSFFRMCRRFMKFLMLILLAVPWLLRVGAYYRYEHKEMTMRKEAAEERGLAFYFPENLILFLTPIHGLFIATYIILSVEMCLFGILGRFGTKASEKLKFVIRKCFRDMREMDKTKVVGWAVKLMLRPCADCGLIGFLIGLLLWPFILPLVVLVLAFYIFPTINITFRILYHLCIYIFPCVKAPLCCHRLRRYLNLKQLDFPEHVNTNAKEFNIKIFNSLANRLYQIIILISCLMSMYAIILLIFEFVSFLAEILIYTMMGTILNAGTILTHLSLAILLGMYGSDCFGHITGTFAEFNKSMNAVVMSLTCGKVDEIVYMTKDKQKNVSFRVTTEQCQDLECSLEITTGTEGRPSWNIKRLLLFLDKTDQPSIPSKFYFKACRMNYYAAPGDVLNRYLGAALEFGAILLFLLFVLLVVMAFGDTYEISTSNRLLATVLGGFVPLLLRRLLFKTYSAPSIDASSIHFKVSLTELLDPYEESWPIYDIPVDSDSVEATTDFDGKYDMVIDRNN